VEAKSLPAMDRNFLGKRTSSDPFAKIKVTEKNQVLKDKTKTIKKECIPYLSSSSLFLKSKSDMEPSFSFLPHKFCSLFQPFFYLSTFRRAN